jgi:Nif-specific regulatory protein
VAYWTGDGVINSDAQQMVAGDNSDVDRIRLERDLYLGLLGLTNRDDPGAFLEEALGLIVRVLNAQQGYLEVSDPNEGPTSWRAAGCSDEQVEVIRSIVSRGIIAEALALGDVVCCPSAILDPRFKDRPSVQASHIEAVLCVPIIRDAPVGVLYLQGRRGTPSFSDQEIERARTFARHLAPLVESLFIRSRQRQSDYVAPYRQRLSLANVVGTSAALGAVFHEVELVAPLDVAVLITGETGTGKSQLARVMHDSGPRRGRPFVELNCANFQDTMLESELFGAVPGAFTGATRRSGQVASAQGGTLFLDEVGELTPAAQAKLLTFLNTREYYPLGSSTPVSADVRVIAATNKDLECEVREKNFRNDLLFRLQVLQIRIPSLAERPEDVIPLAIHFCERAVKSLRLSHVTLSPGALRAIEAAEWPGNARELEHFIQRAAIRASGEGSNMVEASHVFRSVGSSLPPARPQLTFQEETRRFQAGLVLRALEAVDWNVSQAARSLDLTRTHVYNLIKGFELTRRSRTPSS